MVNVEFELGLSHVLPRDVQVAYKLFAKPLPIGFVLDVSTVDFNQKLMALSVYDPLQESWIPLAS